MDKVLSIRLSRINVVFDVHVQPCQKPTPEPTDNLSEPNKFKIPLYQFNILDISNARLKRTQFTVQRGFV